MDPFSLALLMGAIGGGSSIFGDVLQANSQSAAQQLSAQQFEEQMAQGKVNNTGNALMSYLNSGITQGQTGLAATQMNPYAIPMDQNKANVMRGVGQGIDKNGVLNGSIDMSALSPDNMNSAATQFYNYLGAATPQIPLAGSAPASSRNMQTGISSNYNTLYNQIINYLSGNKNQGVPQIPGQAAAPANANAGNPANPPIYGV